MSKSESKSNSTKMRVKMTKPESRNAKTPIRTHDDGTFIRTALLVKGGDTGSVDLVLADGTRIAQINISFLPGDDRQRERLIVDVIDVEDRYRTRRMLAFSNSARKVEDVPEGGKLVSVDFRRATT